MLRSSLHSSLMRRAVEGGHPALPKLYSEQFTDGIGKGNARLRVDPRHGPFIVTALMLPGMEATDSASAVTLMRGKRGYTDGPVRANIVGFPDSLGAFRLAPLPAPIVIGANGSLVANVELDAGTFLASYARMFGFHTDEHFARAVECEGEAFFWSADLDQLTAGAPSDKDELVVPADVLFAHYMLEQVATGGAVLDHAQVTIAGHDLVATPEDPLGIFPPTPEDPRSELGIMAMKGSKVLVNARASSLGTLDCFFSFAGVRQYGEEG